MDPKLTSDVICKRLPIAIDQNSVFLVNMSKCGGSGGVISDGSIGEGYSGEGVVSDEGITAEGGVAESGNRDSDK